MNSLPRRFAACLPLGFLPLLACSSWGQVVNPPAAQSVPVTQATVAFTPGPSALNTLKDALTKAQATVDVAVFRFTDSALIDALCYLSVVKNVKIRVFLNQEDQRLEDGAEVAADGETVMPVNPSYQSIYQKLLRSGVQVYNEGGGSKMHLRCAVIDGQTVLTGSCNWIPQSFKQKYDDVLVLQSPGLAQAYTNKINSLVAQSTLLPSVGPSLRSDDLAFPSDHEEMALPAGSKRQTLQEPVTITTPFTASVYFSPEGSGLEAMLGQVSQATKTVDMAMRWATDSSFAQRLTAAAARKSAPIRLLVNRDMFEGGRQASMNQLIKNGVQMRVSKPKMNMHWKVAVIDGHSVWTGSANATARAASTDQEDMLCADSPELAACYESAYQALVTRLDPPPTPSPTP